MDPTTACEPRMPRVIYLSDAARESALRFPDPVVI